MSVTDWIEMVSAAIVAVMIPLWVLQHRSLSKQRHRISYNQGVLDTYDKVLNDLRRAPERGKDGI